MKKFTFCILLATMSWFATTNAYAKKNSGPTPEEKGLAQINQANAEAFVRFLHYFFLSCRNLSILSLA